MNLVEIIYAMTQAEARITAELPRGLHLVYYAPAGHQPARLIAARHLSTPSPTELRVVRDALLQVLDAHPSLVLDDIADEWKETGRGDWEGYEIVWNMQSAAGAFSPDADTRQRVRLALEQRQRRIDKRRDKAQADAAKKTKSTRRPML